MNRHLLEAGGIAPIGARVLVLGQPTVPGAWEK